MLGVWFIFFTGILLITGHENDTEIPANMSDLEPNFMFEVNLNATPDFEVNFPINYNVTDTNLDDILRHSARTEQLRLRKKKERIILIQRQIMATLGPLNRSNTTNNFISENDRNRIVLKFEHLRPQIQNNNVTGTEGLYAEKIQSFYPSCSIPRNTDVDVWENDNTFYLYYDIISNRHSLGGIVNVSSAKLRLYKNGNGMDNTIIDDNSWIDENATPRQLSDEVLRITVYQFLRPLRRNRRIRKKELDSKLISIYEEGWIEFNIQSSIADWIENSNKNFGLEIVLEDQNSVSQNPSFYIRKMNCSDQNANDPPFPRFMEDDSTHGENNSSLFDNETYPTLDLHTIEFPGKLLDINQNGSEIRVKRYSGCENVESDCVLETSYVSFKELGWEKWIVKPDGFQIQYCLGICKTRGENFENNDFENESSETCIPKELQSIKLEYKTFSGNKYVTELNDFLINSCTCKTD